MVTAIAQNLQGFIGWALCQPESSCQAKIRSVSRKRSKFDIQMFYFCLYASCIDNLSHLSWNNKSYLRSIPTDLQIQTHSKVYTSNFLTGERLGENFKRFWNTKRKDIQKILLFKLLQLNSCLKIWIFCVQRMSPEPSRIELGP